MVVHILGRRPPEIGRFGAQTLPTLVQAPGERGEPSEAAFDYDDSQFGKVLKNALAHEAGDLRLE